MNTRAMAMSGASEKTMSRPFMHANCGNEYNQHQRALTMPLSKKNALTRGSMLRTLALECFSAGCA